MACLDPGSQWHDRRGTRWCRSHSLIKKLLSIYFIQYGPPLSQFREMSSVFVPWIDSVRHRFIAHTHKIKSVVFKEWIDFLDYLGGVTNGIACDGCHDTTPEQDITVGSKSSFTIGFWIGSDAWFTSLPILRTVSDVQARLSVPGITWKCQLSQHCRLVARADSDAQANADGLWLKCTCRSSRQWCSSQHCRLELWTGSVAQDIIAGLTCKPAVISFSYFIVLYNLFFLVESGFAFIFAT